MHHAKRSTSQMLDRVLIGALVLLAALLMGLQAVRAAEIVPSVGITRATSADTETKTFAGLALRGSALPILKTEIGVSYRNEPYNNGDLHVKMWPVTASLWLAPIPTLYAGGGVGWYHTTYDYAQATGIPDETSQEFGTHVGGGIRIPIVPSVASIDLNGRLVKLRERQSLLAPGAVKQSFWSTSLGIAIRI